MPRVSAPATSMAPASSDDISRCLLPFEPEIPAVAVASFQSNWRLPVTPAPEGPSCVGVTRRVVATVSFKYSVAISTLVLVAAACGRPIAPRTAPTPAPGGVQGQAFLDTVEHRSFDFFWHVADPKTGLTPDRALAPTFSSIAAIGFALTAYPIGAERGYVTREEAAERTLATLKFL